MIHPDFSVTANDENVTSVLKQRLVSLSVNTLSEHASDSLMLSLADNDPNARISKPRTGVILSVSLGFKEQGLTHMGDYTVSRLSGGGAKMGATHMNIEARAVPYTGGDDFQTQKTRSWPSYIKIAQMVATIAGEHGLPYECNMELGQIPLAQWDQHAENDLSFLNKIANMYGAYARVAGGKLLFLKWGQAESASGIPMKSIAIKQSDVSSWDWSEEKHEEPGSVTAQWHDMQQAKLNTVTAGNGQPVRQLKYVYKTQQEAYSAAKSQLQHQKHSTMSLTLSLAGDPKITAGRHVNLSDFDQDIDGDWLVKSAAHSINKMRGYMTTIQCSDSD